MPSDFLALRSAVLLLPPATLAILAAVPRARPALVPMLLALAVAQRVIETRSLFPSVPKSLFYPAIRPLTDLPPAAEPYRVAASGFSFIPNTATLYELEDPRGYQALHHRRLVDTFPLWSVRDSTWFNRIGDFGRPFVSFLNVRYALIPADRPPPDGWRRAARYRGTVLWENPRSLPRAFVPPRVRLGGAEQAVIAEMSAETDFAQRAWITSVGQPAVGQPVGRRNGPGAVSVRRQGLRYRLDASMERPGWIVVSVTAWAGWRAFSDGEELPVAFANHAFVGLRAPQGESSIELVYRPRSFEIGRRV
jgi:hypothetical protein